MWVFFKDGFISAVQNKDDPEELIVRARSKEHLKSFLGPFSEDFITETPDADYQFRAFVDREVFVALMADHANEVDYPNFKKSCSHLSYLWQTVLLKTWAACFDFQLRSKVGPGDLDDS